MARYWLTTAHFNKCCREIRKAHFFIFKCVCACVRACAHLSLTVAEITKQGSQNSFPIYICHTYHQNTVRLESRCALRLRYVHLVVSIEVAVEVCCCFTVSIVKQRLKCNTGKVCNCLIQFLLTMVRGHHLQHLLLVHNYFPNAIISNTYNNIWTIYREV
jgi:hypothetical protein